MAVGLFLGVLTVAPPAAGFAAGTAEVKQAGELPEGLPAALAAKLETPGAEVLLDGAPLARFWFCKEWKAAASPSTELGVNFGKIETGSLVGVVQFLQDWKDYKENAVPAGVYTLRYEVMPADGNHMGVSPYRDYFLLVPAEKDTDLEKNYEFRELVELSLEATGVPHPGVMALYPIWDDVPEAPAMLKNEMDQWSLVIRRDDMTIGIVVEGHGEI
ncbi:MAG: hypothetical protein Kow00109_17650 [Acidobacteriota bacterium]